MSPPTAQGNAREFGAIMRSTPQSTHSLITEDEARALISQIKISLTEVTDSIWKLYQGQGWIALGYSSWLDLCAAEFHATAALGRDDREALVRELFEKGLSTRAIAGATHLSKSTVNNTTRRLVTKKSAAPQVSKTGHLAPVTGLDGKTYPAEAKPRKRDRKPITDGFRDLAFHVYHGAERLQQLALDDDQFRQNRDAITASSRSDIERAVAALTAVLDALPAGTE